jgi:hypothetical protein
MQKKLAMHEGTTEEKWLNELFKKCLFTLLFVGNTYRHLPVIVIECLHVLLLLMSKFIYLYKASKIFLEHCYIKCN